MASPNDYSLDDVLLCLRTRGLLDDYELRGDTVCFQQRGARLELPQEEVWPYVLGLIQGCRRASEHGATAPLGSVEAFALQRSGRKSRQGLPPSSKDPR